ncbi:hypothetical protein [Fibrella arboris]|uniref:hypothetical protein n=1 Tax=Fibrella arboris TaxID=3242486 RepID=UPI003522598F
MVFELLPTLDVMLDLYEKPRTIERFQAYLALLQGDTRGNLALPISGFNPMAKEPVRQKLIDLNKVGAEDVIRHTLHQLNTTLSVYPGNHVIRLALNLADDIAGGWTNRFTTDYDSKFNLNALVSRSFCTPLFWASDVYTPSMIAERTIEYAYRTIYWLTHPKPITLADHVEQEKFVARHTARSVEKPDRAVSEAVDTFYRIHQQSDDYALIFNFFYGDLASESLGLPAHGMQPLTGYDYAVLMKDQPSVRPQQITRPGGFLTD